MVKNPEISFLMTERVDESPAGVKQPAAELLPGPKMGT